MKKLLTLLILSLLVLTSCSQNKVLSEQEIETALVNMSEDEKFFKNIDATINFSVKGEAKPSPFIPQEAKPANALQKIDSQFTFNFQFMEEPQQEMFMSGEIRGQGLNNEEIREEFYSYGHQVGDQMKIYTSEGEGWQEQEMVDTFKPQSFDFKGSKEIAENFVEAMTKHSDNFSIAEKVVMVGSTPTTEIILPINPQNYADLILDFTANTQDNQEMAQVIPMLMGMLGDEFLTLRMNIDNNTKSLKRMRFDFDLDAPLFSFTGLEPTELYFEFLINDPYLQKLTPSIALPQIKK